jgi:hypothetical protein
MKRFGKFRVREQSFGISNGFDLSERDTMLIIQSSFFRLRQISPSVSRSVRSFDLLVCGHVVCDQIRPLRGRNLMASFLTLATLGLEIYAHYVAETHALLGCFSRT